MNIYQKYTSREPEDRRLPPSESAHGGISKLRPLSGQFDIYGGHTQDTKLVSQWQSIFPTAAFFGGHDAFFGPVVTMVFKNDATSKISTMSITKFGCNVFENLILDSTSRFWPACDNLKPEHRDSNVRKALAITNLKNYNKLWKNKGQVPVTLAWDETNAGALASEMEVLVGRSPEELGTELLTLGLLQDYTISSTVVDVVYDNKNPANEETIALANNKIVMLLGDQMDHLFDPLLEYSPQNMEYEYKVPMSPTLPILHSHPTVKAILKELLDVQTHYTMDLVCASQDFIIPLRVDVLNSSSTSTIGISKVNLVFPPTIDEVTRINCIAHDALTQALHFGYMEVFKVLSAILPFFYTAYVRHQANLSKFHSRYAKFVYHNSAHVFESTEINKGGYTPRGLESIISGSIFELPRMKLIVKRLYDTISNEKERMRNFENKEDPESEELASHFNVIMEIIDSFGYHENEVEKTKQRVFTPTGKLLTELATGWPTELQYGWMDRKVVGVFQVTNILNESNGPDEVLIIFSDHLLFIEIDNQSSKKSVLLLPEILMNSLINGKPLPKFSHFPKLKVKHWCTIDTLAVRSYETDSNQFLNFTTFGDNCFRSKDETSTLSVQNYKVIPDAETKSPTCQEIMDLICKAQVLSKSVPFHLFKSDDTQVRTYYCAHDRNDYEEELSRSSVMVFLNMTKADIKNTFEKCESAFFIYNVAFLNDHKLQLNGYSRHKLDECEVDEIISVDDFNGTLRESLSDTLEAMFRSSFLSPVMTSTNFDFLNFFISSASPKREEAPKETKKIVAPAAAEKKLPVEGSNEFCESYPQTTETIVQPEENGVNASTSDELNTTKAAYNSPGQRKSLISTLLGKMKRKNKVQRNENVLTKDGTSAKKNIPDTVIPRGRKLVYKKLYTPAPRLREPSNSSSVVQTPANAIKKDNVEQKKSVPEPLLLQPRNEDRVISTNTAASSRYTDRSLDVNSGFVFPSPVVEHHFDPEARFEEPINETENVTKVQVTPAIPSPHVNARQDSDIPRAFPELRETNELVSNTEAYSESGIKANIENGWEKFQEGAPESEVVTIKKRKSIDSTATITLGEKTAQEVQPSWQPAQGELKISESNEVQTKPKRRIFSSQDIANALENINASGIMPEVYAKYKQYDEVPTSTFYSDGEKNWIVYTRDNSSNLQAEIQAMKHEARMRSLDIINVGTPLSMIPPAQQFDSSDGTFSSMEYGTFGHDPQELSTNSVVKTSIPDYLWKIAKESSVTSFNSAEFINGFSKQLEADFHLGSLQDLSLRNMEGKQDGDMEVTISDKQTTISDDEVSNTHSLQQRSPVPTIVIGSQANEKIGAENREERSGLMPIGTPSNTSSDDEYFSSNDFATALENYVNLPIELEEHETMTSSSSDRTLMNDFFAAPREIEEVGLGLKLDSVAYLSDILNGTVKF